MPQKINICIGSIKTELNYSNDSEKEILDNCSKELNTEFNNLLLEFGRINDIILLFFLLFKTQQSIFEISNEDYDFFSILKEISCFLNEKGNIENQLIIGNIVKRNVFKKLKNTGITNKKNNKIEEQTILNILDNFINITTNKIKKVNKIIKQK